MFEAAYIVCIAAHCVAFYYGLRTWRLRESAFAYGGGCFARFNISRAEREFVLVGIGSLINLIYCAIFSMYLIVLNAHAAGVLELGFTLYHLLSSAVAVLVQKHFYIEALMHRQERGCYAKHAA